MAERMYIPFRRVSTADNNAALVKTGRRVVGAIVVGNVNASPRYLKLYDKATTPAPATDTPVFVVIIPGSTAGAGLSVPIPDGINFTLGLGMAIVAGMGDTDNTSIGAGDVVVSLGYE